MPTRHKKNHKRGRLVVPVLSTAVIGYFAFHIVHGTFGLEAKARLETERSELAGELAMLIEKRQHLEKRLQLLQDGSLERDMVDERARALLDVSRPDEIVIYRP